MYPLRLVPQYCTPYPFHVSWTINTVIPA
uniref:Uncharacterized protein n=1 Tax=Anguilla anguilla TaxID=7936 RepID=A0A0E9PLV3_ANGAN